MNIYKKELKAGLKPFLFWTLGLFVLMFAGVIKYTGVSVAEEGVAQLMLAFPPIVQAVVGITGIDVGTFGGYYALLAQYAVILTAVYAVHLGNSAVSREMTDKTYEFMFTRPRSRSHILAKKLLAGLTYLTVYCLLCMAFSVLATEGLGLGENITGLFCRYTAAAWLCGLVFFSLAALFMAVSKSWEKGAKRGNRAVLLAFAIGVVHDMLESAWYIRPFTPFKYFAPAELIAGSLDFVFAALCLAIAAAALAAAFHRFERRDLAAV